MKEQYANQPLLEMKNISKAFYGVNVLQEVMFSLLPGEVHVLAGENGAGKSTLMKILSGVHTEYGGELFINGKPVRFTSPSDAALNGISMIHQELSVIPGMNVVDNIFLGREETRGGIWMNHRKQQKHAEAILKQLGIHLDLSEPVGTYPISIQQMVEIAKALAFDSRIIVMDEPTSALNRPEVERLFHLIDDLRSKGCGIVYISHKMDEIYKIADRITVLRDGLYVGTETKDRLPEQDLVKRMVGRELTQQFPKRTTTPGETCFEVRNFSVQDPTGFTGKVVDEVSFSLKKGEILGIGGLEGAGNHELFAALFGSYGKLPADITLNGEKFQIKNASHSISKGLAFLTNDRKGNGLVLNMSITRNTTLASIPGYSPNLFMQPVKERAAAEKHSRDMNTRLTSLSQPVSDLSGGNQQKVVLAKWLETRPRVLLLDEPTRGVDVGAKKEIYDLMNQWTDQGISILLITSEMPELIAMSDRIIVMHRGRITAGLNKEDATQEAVLQAAMGRNLSDKEYLQ